MAILSHKASTSLKICDDRNIVLPRDFSSRINVINSCCITGSRPEVGSSRIRICGSCMNAATMASFLFSPRLISRVFLSALSSNLFSSSLQNESSSHPCIFRVIFRKPSPVNPAGSAISPGRYPIICFSSADYCQLSFPITEVLPASGFENPMICLMVVVLPAPLGPRKP